MRRRFQQGSLKKVHGSYIAQWWDDGHRRSRTLGRVSRISKSEASTQLAAILEPINNRSTISALGEQTFNEFVEQVYFRFYRRKWKASTLATNQDRIRHHLVREFRSERMSSFTRDQLQTFLDNKSSAGLAFSTVDHLRWDLKQIFRMAVAEAVLQKNPAGLLFTPRETRRPQKSVPNWEQVRKAFSLLDLRERLIYMFAFVAGMRPGEIFGLKWGRISDRHVDITQRVYRGKVDSPKTSRSVRQAALADDLVSLLDQWKAIAFRTDSDAWLFPSERLITPLTKENCWRRAIKPRLEPAGLAWINFQALRRAHSSLLRAAGEDPKVVADQLGHGIGTNLDVYTTTSLERRLEGVNKLAAALRIM